MGTSASKDNYEKHSKGHSQSDDKSFHTFPRNILPVNVKPAHIRPSSRSKASLNLHEVQPDIKIHAIASNAYIDPGENALMTPLGEVTDEQLLAEIYRRKIDIHRSVTETLVRDTYVFIKNIGHGASGDVFLVTNRLTNANYACKVVRRDSSINDAKSMSTEIEIMKRIRHTNIVAMYELYQSPRCLWLILEYVNGGDLRNHLRNSVDFSEAIAASYMKQIFLAIHYMHTLGIVHRDLKLDNVLRQVVNDMNVMKVADFGLSALVRIGENGYDAETSEKRKDYRALREMWGTKEYFAPEVIDQAYGPQADIWSLGCVLYEMLSGTIAFRYRECSAELYARIKSGVFDLNIPQMKPISVEAKDLIRGLLTIDPTKRLSATEALTHPWITGACHTSYHRVILEATIDNFKAAAAHRQQR